MKISLIYEFLSEQGGLEREIINHANFLKQEGHEVEVLTCHFDKKILELLPFKGIKIKTISKFQTNIESLDLILCFLGFTTINQENPDLFLSYSFPSNLLIKNKKTKKVFYMNHYPHFLYLNFKEKIEWATSTQGIKRWIAVALSLFLGNFLKNLDRKLVTQNNLIFSNSSFTKKKLDKIYGINSILSYPPIDPVFIPSKRKFQNKFIFSSSRIIPDKKYEWLIESLTHCENKLPLYIAGSVNNDYKKKLLNLAKSKKVELKFLGRISTNEIVKHYSNAEVFAFSTPQEDFGLVPVESLACGTPCIVWGDGAGPTEQIIDGENGFLANPYDLKDFAIKIDKCLNTHLKLKNRKKILDSSRKFSFNEVKKGFIEEIQKLR